ncbi:MAG: nucleoside hydrolase [Acidobacteriia bacterium]|nr:nucleoside hydrolase [Terriglobia bacterium]
MHPTTPPTPFGRLAAVLAALLLASALRAAQPVRLVFDTDIGNDVDDALALAMIHALESRGEAQLRAVTVSKDNRYAAPFVDLVNTFYGRGGISIGVVKNGKTPEDSDMIRVPSERRNAQGSYVYPHRLTDGRNAPDATSVLRRVLAAEPDGSVVIVVVGFSTNLARLLASGPDQSSPLPGAKLVADKVRLLSAMAGQFPRGQPEYNVKTDIPSARKVFEEWPSPIVFSGFEVGQALLFPAASIERDFSWVPDHPVAEAYRCYMRMPYDRPSWDLTAVLYAVRPERNYFTLSAPGRVTVDAEGQTLFNSAPDGKHRFLILGEGQTARTLEALILLASQPRAPQ